METKKLIMVTGKNNNKFYNMIPQGDGNWLAQWGRVGVTKMEKNYDSSVFEKKLREKKKKGYVDITDLAVDNGGNGSAATKSSPVAKGSLLSRTVANIITTLQRYAKKSVSQNYLVTVEGVTQAMCEEAQRKVDELAGMVCKFCGTEDFNNKLLEIFQVLPRRMKKVQDFLVPFRYVDNDDKVIYLKKFMQREQDTLDQLAGQVGAHQAQKATGGTSLDDTLKGLGLEARDATADEITKIKKMVSDSDVKRQVARIISVENKNTQKVFDSHVDKASNKKTKWFWHGSRNENWFSIISTGLLIRPSGAVITGAMFGNGIYFASRARKSLGYTSLRGSYWASGSSNVGFMAVYDVHLGREYRIKRHNSECYKFSPNYLKRKGGFDSVVAEKGADLYNDEFIVYSKDQCTVKFIVEFKS